MTENAAIADGFLAAPLEVLMRFGRWDDILKEPEPPELFPIARAMRHHARGVAYAAKGQVGRGPGGAEGVPRGGEEGAEGGDVRQQQGGRPVRRRRRTCSRARSWSARGS